MSSRVLKKLQGGAGELELVDDGIDEDQEQVSDDDDQESIRGKGKHLNPFDLLNQQSFSESEVKEDDNETEHASATANVPAGPAASKKKKKKRKKKTKYTGNHISSEDNELTDKYISDIDSLIGKVADTSAKTQKTIPPRIEICKSLLTVELKNLNPQYEMRRTFGKRVVRVENKRGRSKLTLKTTYMVTAKETWPPVMKNIISMKPVPAPDFDITSKDTTVQGVQWFGFEHSQKYQSVQNQFLAAVERTDFDFLTALIRSCPYHIDSIIQLSDMCKMTEDYSSATELIERGVLVLETSLHPSFSLTSGNCRMDYRRQENRCFFIVLFRHAQYLEARACCRTAFELSKLILSLDPDTDPLAIVLVLDYYAIRSKQYSWLIKYYEEYDAVRNLLQLPNMAYSYALALFCLLGECEKSDKALKYALLMFPGVLRPLLEEMSVQTDKRVLSNPYFCSEISGSQSPALHQLVCLYVCRAKVIWRQHEVLPWLERNVNSVLDRIERNDAIITDYNQIRALRYGKPPRPILRHVLLSDFKEKVPLASFLSKEHTTLVSYDPFPPPDSINSYERKSSSSSPTTATNRPLSMFFQSLLPTFNMPHGHVRAAGANNAQPQALPRAPLAQHEADPGDRQQQFIGFDDGEGGATGTGEAGTSYHDLTQSLHNIVDAMRDFLHNFRLNENLPAGENDDNDSSEEDTSDYFD
ncbi:transcription factor 25 [Teleopsis dalmanni]|uniref:transcription factor 25 n=1 Tax=Teleopsis dalmanni TaxID=139649 RepID=UPI0018CE0E1C|nr:transcription factor 25 [Teleopsis dalmanni]